MKNWARPDLKTGVESGRDQRPRTELEAAQIEIERLKHQLYLAEMGVIC